MSCSTILSIPLVATLLLFAFAGRTRCCTFRRDHDPASAVAERDSKVMAARFRMGLNVVKNTSDKGSAESHELKMRLVAAPEMNL